MGHEDLKVEGINCRALTVSSSRTGKTDKSGKLIEKLLSMEGHTVEAKRIVLDQPESIRKEIKEAAGSGARVLVITGGTGLSLQDQTVDVLKKLEDKLLPGFGEAFRRLSFEDIGPRAILSRARASVVGDTLVFSLPGSTAAVELGMKELILPAMGHALYELDKEKEDAG